MAFAGVKVLGFQSDIRDYDTALREYDLCVIRVERSVDSYNFNNELVTVIEEEYPRRSDISKRLRDKIVKPLTLRTCGTEPTSPNFLTSFRS